MFCVSYWIPYWVPDFLQGPLLGTRLNARSGTGYPILCFLSHVGSGTGYRITICIYLYRSRYRVPDHVKYSFYQTCCRVPGPVFSGIGLLPDPVLGTRLNAISGTGYQILCSSSNIGSGTGYRITIGAVFIYTRSGTGYQIMLSILFWIFCPDPVVLYFLLGPVLGTWLLPDRVLGPRSCFFPLFPFRVLDHISVYLYPIWCRVPDPVRYSFYPICFLLPDPVFCIFYWNRYWLSGLVPDPVLVTRLNARDSTILCRLVDTGFQSVFIYTESGTGCQILLSILFTGSVVGNQILCFILFYRIQYWIPDLLPGPVLGTGLNARSGTGYQILCFCLLPDLVLGTGSQTVSINTGSGTGFQILLGILFPDLLLCTRSCILCFLLDPVLGTGLNARSGTGYQILCFCVISDPVLGTGSQ